MSTMSVAGPAPIVRPARTVRPVRLTRRGRLAVVGALIAGVSGLGSVVGHAAVASAGGHAAVREVTVRPGETLWALATRIAPHADPRVVVAQLQAANHLSQAAVPAGRRLVISGVSGS